MNNKETIVFFKTIIILSIVSYIYYFLVYYPIPNEGFDSWHIGLANLISQQGYLTESYFSFLYPPAYAGFYSLTIVISFLSGISIEKIFFIPFAIFLFILLSFLLIKLLNYSKDYFITSGLSLAIVVLLATKYDSLKLLSFWKCHSVGFLIFLLFLSLVALKCNGKFKDNKIFSILIILTIITENYISYKLTFLMIATLLSLQIIEWIWNEDFWNNLKINSSYGILSIIGLIFVLTFNYFIYKESIPAMSVATEVTATGASKAITLFGGSEGSLSSFYFQFTPLVVYANIIFYLVFFIFGIILSYIFYQKFRYRNTLNSSEKIILAWMISSFMILIIYSNLGIFEISYLIYALAFGVVIIHQQYFKQYKTFFFVLISIILISNIIVTFDNTVNNHYEGVRDWNNNLYLKTPYAWYETNIVKEKSYENKIVLSDVYTAGNFAMYGSTRNETNLNPIIFSENNIEDYFNLDIPQNNYYIINYRLNHFYSSGWRTFKSWRENEQYKNYNNANSIYNSDSISIIMV